MYRLIYACGKVLLSGCATILRQGYCRVSLVLLQPCTLAHSCCCAGVLRQSERALTTPLPRVYDFDPEQNKPAPTSEATLAMSGESLGQNGASGALADTGEGLKVCTSPALMQCCSRQQLDD